MKKTRKIIALVLALTFMFCFMAMSASAATTEIQPRTSCASCGSTNTVTGSRSIKVYEQYVGGCSNITAAHTHVIYRNEYFYNCASCGRSTVYNTTYTTVCK